MLKYILLHIQKSTVCSGLAKHQMGSLFFYRVQTAGFTDYTVLALKKNAIFNTFPNKCAIQNMYYIFVWPTQQHTRLSLSLSHMPNLHWFIQTITTSPVIPVENLVPFTVLGTEALTITHHHHYHGRCVWLLSFPLPMPCHHIIHICYVGFHAIPPYNHLQFIYTHKKCSTWVGSLTWDPEKVCHAGLVWIWW